MNIKTHQACTVYAEGWLEVGGFVEIVFEAFAHGMAVGSDEIRFHLCFANHPISENRRNSLYTPVTTILTSDDDNDNND